MGVDAEHGHMVGWPSRFLDLVGVELPIGAGGLVRNYPCALRIGETVIPSVASALASPQLRGVEAAEDVFGIDFLDFDTAIVGDAAMNDCFINGFVGVLEFDVFANDSDADTMLRGD